MSVTSSSTDTIDLADIARTLRRGWRWILGGVIAGGLVALVIVVFGPRRFDGSATAIIRSTPEGGGSLLARLGDAGAGAASMLGSSASAPIETDLQILTSRAVVGAAVDSLLLQVEVRSPSLPSKAIVREVGLPGAFRPLEVSFRRTGQGRYHYESDGGTGDVAAGGLARVRVGTVLLRTVLPESFTIQLLDREDAIFRTSRNLVASKAGGEVVRVAYRARDSVTAASVPNAAIVSYLARRRTDDRGANAHRAEFLIVQIDSTAALQAIAENKLRAFQERTGLIDPYEIAKLELNTVVDLRRNLGSLQVEESALDQLLAKVESGHMTARQLVAFPSFLKSPGINDLLRQLAELETERTKLLERRLESDEQVGALSRSIANLEGQLVPLARAYAGALHQQRADITSQIGVVATKLVAFPGGAQEAAQQTRELYRLTQLTLALQSQLVQARLASIAEGGDVRPLDSAVPPREPSFPRPLMTAGLGVGAGLVLGLLAAILSASHGRYLEDPSAIERVLGVPAVRYLRGLPLLMSGREQARTLLLIPVDSHASTEQIATRLADTALARGGTATVLDFSAPTATHSGAAMSSAMAEAEAASSIVLVQLAELSSETTAALLSPARPVLLVVPGRKVRRQSLASAVETLRRLDIPCAGVVMADSPTRELQGS